MLPPTARPTTPPAIVVSACLEIVETLAILLTIVPLLLNPTIPPIM